MCVYVGTLHTVRAQTGTDILHYCCPEKVRGGISCHNIGNESPERHGGQSISREAVARGHRSVFTHKHEMVQVAMASSARVFLDDGRKRWRFIGPTVIYKCL